MKQHKKNLIIPIASFAIVIIALIAGILFMDTMPDRPVAKAPTVIEEPEAHRSSDEQIRKADTAYQAGEFDTAITILQKEQSIAQDKNDAVKLGEITDKIKFIQSVKSL